MYEFIPLKINVDEYLKIGAKNAKFLDAILFLKSNEPVSNGQIAAYYSLDKDDLELLKLLAKDKLIKLKIIGLRQAAELFDVSVEFLDVYGLRQILSLLLSANDGVEPYGKDKQLSIIKKDIHKKFKQYENKNFLFKKDDIDIVARKNIEIVGALNFLEKRGYLKINKVYCGSYRDEPPSLLETEITIKDKLPNEIIEAREKEFKERMEANKKNSEEIAKQMAERQKTLATQALENYEWRCSECKYHLANVKKMTNGQLEKKCPKCKQDNLLTIKNGKIS